MKTAFFRTIFLLLTLSLISVATAAQDEKPSETSDRHVVLKKEGEKMQPTRPRMPERIAIGCMYEAAGESLSFQFFEEMGGVTVTVINTTIHSACPVASYARLKECI